MTQTGIKKPTSVISNDYWVNPDSTFLNDGSFAVSSDTATTSTMVLGGFGFSIPSDATITAFDIKVKGKRTSATNPTLTISLYDDVTNPSLPAYYGSLTNNSFTTSNTEITVTGVNYTFGTTVGYQLANNTKLRLVTTAGLSIDCVTVNITYSQPSATPITSSPLTGTQIIQTLGHELALPCTSSDLYIYLKSFKHLQNASGYAADIVQADLGSGVYATIDTGTDAAENVLITTVAKEGELVKIGFTSITNRGLLPYSPFSSDPSFRKPHGAGSTLKITNNAPFESTYLRQDGLLLLSPANPIKYTSSPVINDPLMVATKEYVDGIAIAGSPDATNTSKGISRLSVASGTTIGTATITIATPAVVTINNHGLIAGDLIKFTTTGALPTGLTAGVGYYVISAGLTTNNFEVSATVNGTAINTSGTQSGVHTVTRYSPISVATEDPRLPTQAENDAMVGTSGTAVSSSNKFVDNADTATSGANKVLRLDGTGKLPSLDGSQLTNITVTPSIPYFKIASAPDTSSIPIIGSDASQTTPTYLWHCPAGQSTVYRLEKQSSGNYVYKGISFTGGSGGNIQSMTEMGGKIYVLETTGNVYQNSLTGGSPVLVTGGISTYGSSTIFSDPNGTTIWVSASTTQLKSYTVSGSVATNTGTVNLSANTNTLGMYKTSTKFYANTNYGGGGGVNTIWSWNTSGTSQTSQTVSWGNYENIGGATTSYISNFVVIFGKMYFVKLTASGTTTVGYYIEFYQTDLT